MGFQPYHCKSRFSELFISFADICKSGSIPSDVEEKLRLEWPFQEQVLLREQYQKKFTNSTYSSKK